MTTRRRAPRPSRIEHSLRAQPLGRWLQMRRPVLISSIAFSLLGLLAANAFDPWSADASSSAMARATLFVLIGHLAFWSVLIGLRLQDAPRLELGPRWLDLPPLRSILLTVLLLCLPILTFTNAVVAKYAWENRAILSLTAAERAAVRDYDAAIKTAFAQTRLPDEPALRNWSTQWDVTVLRLFIDRIRELRRTAEVAAALQERLRRPAAFDRVDRALSRARVLDAAARRRALLEALDGSRARLSARISAMEAAIREIDAGLPAPSEALQAEGRGFGDGDARPEVCAIIAEQCAMMGAISSAPQSLFFLSGGLFGERAPDLPAAHLIEALSGPAGLALILIVAGTVGVFLHLFRGASALEAAFFLLLAAASLGVVAALARGVSGDDGSAWLGALAQITLIAAALGGAVIAVAARILAIDLEPQLWRAALLCLPAAAGGAAAASLLSAPAGAEGAVSGFAVFAAAWLAAPAMLIIDRRVRRDAARPSAA